MLWKANLPRRRKALLIVMFGGGIFVTMAGILRCVLILTVCTSLPKSYAHHIDRPHRIPLLVHKKQALGPSGKPSSPL
jgi:hypothetical protein